MDTTSTTIELIDIQPVTGAGKLLAVASARVVIDGVAVEIRGIQLKADAGKTSAHLPTYRDHKGQWVSAVVLPDELRDALGDMVIAGGLELGVLKRLK